MIELYQKRLKLTLLEVREHMLCFLITCSKKIKCFRDHANLVINLVIARKFSLARKGNHTNNVRQVSQTKKYELLNSLRCRMFTHKKMTNIRVIWHTGLYGTLSISHPLQVNIAASITVKYQIDLHTSCKVFVALWIQKHKAIWLFI